MRFYGTVFQVQSKKNEEKNIPALVVGNLYKWSYYQRDW